MTHTFITDSEENVRYWINGLKKYTKKVNNEQQNNQILEEIDEKSNINQENNNNFQRYSKIHNIKLLK